MPNTNMDIFNSGLTFWMSVLIYSLVSLQSECTHLYESQNLLKDKLVNYTKAFRPIYNQSRALDLHLSFAIVSLQDFNEREERLTITGVLHCEWVDEVFTWEPEYYGGIDYLILDSSFIWIPRMILVNSVYEVDKISAEWHTVHISNSGHVSFDVGGVFDVSCSSDVTYYPWDRQFCELRFLAWGYSEQGIHFIHLNDSIGQLLYTDHGMWKLVDSQTGMIEGPSIVTFGIHIERKPRFVIVNIVAPIIIMSFMNILLFLIPSESGERISYNITILLATAVFLTLVGDNLPKTSSPMSTLSFYLLSVLCINVLITFMNIMSLRMYYTDDKEKVRSFWGCLANCVRCRILSNHSNRKHLSRKIINVGNCHVSGRPVMDPSVYVVRNSMSATDNGVKVSVQKHTTKEEAIYKVPEPTAREHDEDITWKEVSHAFDKVCFVLFACMVVVLTVMFMLGTSGTLD